MDISTLFNNQIVSGGLLLGGMAGIITWCKNIPKNLFLYIKNKIVFTLQITNKDCYFDWISSFLSKEYGDKKFRHVRPLICMINDQPNVKFLPISGRYLVKYKGKWIFISCYREEQKLDGMSIGFTETISLTSLNKNKKIFQDFIKDVVLEYSNANKDKLIIKTFDRYSWIATSTRDKRNKDSLFYNDTILEIIEQDLTKFYDRKEWYKYLGIQYKRGYLFFGEPGNGKTTLAMYLASKFNKALCVLNLKSFSSDESLVNAFSSLPHNSIVIMEDVDIVVPNRGDNTKDRITLAGLLNIMDGPMSKEGTVVIMTTNFKDRIDDAVIRPGRIDLQLEIKNPTINQIEKYINRFYNSNIQINHLNNINISMSTLQELCLSTASINEAIEKLSNLQQ